MNIRLLIIAFISIIVGIYLGVHFSGGIHRGTLAANTHLSPVPTAVSPTPGIPTTVLIPKINVQAAVESVGVDSEGRMGVPVQWIDTAWYNLGPRPGEKGSAVIDGHVDDPQGKPAVFWNIKTLKSGDQIKVSDSLGHSYTYQVSNVVEYPLTDIPLNKIFATKGPSRLNLITCSGTWDRAKHEYTSRTVVYSDLISD